WGERRGGPGGEGCRAHTATADSGRRARDGAVARPRHGQRDRRRRGEKLVGADVEGRALGPRGALEVVGHVGDRGARVARRRGRAQVIVVAGDVDEQRRGRGDDRVRVLTGRGAPGRQGYAGAAGR